MTTAALVPWRERYLTFGAPHLLQPDRDEVLAIRNLAQRPIVGRLAAALSNPAAREYAYRYDLASFRRFAEANDAVEVSCPLHARNAIAVFRGRRID